MGAPAALELRSIFTILQYHYGLLLNATFRVEHEIIEYIKDEYDDYLE